MTLYIGVDIHARQQTVSFLDTGDGTTGQVELQHERDDIKGFYSQFQGEVIIGIEACGYTNWFEELMEQLGHQLLVGDAAEIRRLAGRRQKNDRRDAELLLDLLVHDEFPALFRYSRESREVLRQLRYRQKLVKLRTMVANTLHALAINAGLSLRAQLLTKGGRKQLAGLQLSVISQQQRDELLSLADELTRRMTTVERWLQAQAQCDVRVRRLQTHPGVGLLTSLCLVHTLGDLSRFPSTRKVAAYVGFDPMEDPSAERKAYGGISKAGSRLLRYLLVEAGQTAAKNDEQLKQFYRRLLPRRGKARAKVAVASQALDQMLHHGTCRNRLCRVSPSRQERGGVKRQWAVDLPGEARRPGGIDACTLIGRSTSLLKRRVRILLHERSAARIDVAVPAV